jgi:hypothetical protein
MYWFLEVPIINKIPYACHKGFLPLVPGGRGGVLAWDLLFAHYTMLPVFSFGEESLWDLAVYQFFKD